MSEIRNLRSNFSNIEKYWILCLFELNQRQKKTFLMRFLSHLLYNQINLC
ncbi:hypothetical protein LEP1GSC050_2791 [Leptospira broomii serovar Hurstbridge str. 5399]|uniref:Uncharacterized protein n=1 Tax=Leptospira broomii serovar Hurstbridge str. 5399 TaxID=1049789 RepID=T0GFU5_9LEPT|nr:hypothetical protein LEP1GSC050_2791 [Leptospira broomii serovar Hurstbridge str. 5399]